MYQRMVGNNIEKNPNKEHLKIFTCTLFKYINCKYFKFWCTMFYITILYISYLILN